MRTAIKVSLRLSDEQKASATKQFGCYRWLWNHFLAQAISIKDSTGYYPSFLDYQSDIPPIKQEHPWLKDASASVLQMTVRTLQQAANRYKSKISWKPKFKQKHGRQSVVYPAGVRVDWDENRIYLPKIGWVKASLHRRIDGVIKSVSFTKSASGRYSASIFIDTGEKSPDKPDYIDLNHVIAIDMGLNHYVTSSSGEKVENPRIESKRHHRRQKLQRSMSRKQFGSKNYDKAKVKHAKYVDKTKRIKEDFQHKLSKRLVDENQVIIVENLNVSGLMKNRKISRSMNDAAFSLFIKKIEYKCDKYGSILVKCGRFFASSKICSNCGFKLENLSLSTRSWNCPECKSHHDRDENAARNLLNEGIRMLMADGYTVTACGGLRKTSSEAVAIEAGNPSPVGEG